MTEPAPDGDGRQARVRDVLLVALVAVGVVLGAAVLTALLPADLQSIVFRTPLVIVILIGGTVLALWLVVRGR